MSNTNHDQVIVVTEQNRRRKGFMWVAAGTAALLIGGSTFALWSASDTFSGGDITAGDLNLVQSADTSFWDVSNDRKDATDPVTGTDGTQQPGHEITDVATWRIAPGDKLAASFSATATLDGDNLVARVGIDGLDKLQENVSGINYSYEVYYDGKLLVTETALPKTADAPLLYLSAPATGQDAGAEDATNGILGAATAVGGAAAQSAVFGMPTTSEDLTVVIYASFYEDQNGDFRYQATDVTVEDRIDVTAVDTLGELTVSLNQVRDTGAQFN